MDISAAGTLKLNTNAALQISGLGFDASLQASRGITFGGTSGTTTDNPNHKSFNFQLLHPTFQWNALTTASANAALDLLIDFNVAIENLAEVTLNTKPYVTAAVNMDLSANGAQNLGCSSSGQNLHVALATGVYLAVSGSLDINLEIWSYKKQLAQIALPDIGPFSLPSFCLTIPGLNKLASLQPASGTYVVNGLKIAKTASADESDAEADSEESYEEEEESYEEDDQ